MRCTSPPATASTGWPAPRRNPEVSRNHSKAHLSDRSGRAIMARSSDIGLRMKRANRSRYLPSASALARGATTICLLLSCLTATASPRHSTERIRLSHCPGIQTQVPKPPRISMKNGSDAFAGRAAFRVVDGLTEIVVADSVVATAALSRGEREAVVACGSCPVMVWAEERHGHSVGGLTAVAEDWTFLLSIRVGTRSFESTRLTGFDQFWSAFERAFPRRPRGRSGMAILNELFGEEGFRLSRGRTVGSAWRDDPIAELRAHWVTPDLPGALGPPAPPWRAQHTVRVERRGQDNAVEVPAGFCADLTLAGRAVSVRVEDAWRHYPCTGLLRCSSADVSVFRRRGVRHPRKMLPRVP